jgi:hypothetical protein
MRRRSTRKWWRIASPWRWADRVCCRVWLLSMTLSSGLPQKKAREERDDALAWAQHKIEERLGGERVKIHDVPADSKCMDYCFEGGFQLVRVRARARRDAVAYMRANLDRTVYLRTKDVRRPTRFVD